ncbi:MAG: peptidoglycan DD-metalloendopeptidase family protein [Chitinivibrionales bacterium]|nr:peptidoglycan DD-metalloendopeptidase family protein [Chitinivibrionales bacterium]
MEISLLRFSHRGPVRLDWKQKRGSQVFVIVLLILFPFLTPAVAQKGKGRVLKEYDTKIQSNRSQLDSIKTLIAKGRSKLRELEKKEGTSLSQLKQLESNIVAAEKYVDILTSQINSLSLRVDELSDSLAMEKKSLVYRQNKMKKRLENMYKMGNAGLLQIIMTSSSMSDMLHRVRYFQELSRYDQVLFHQIDSTKGVIEEHRDTLETRLAELSAAKEEKTHEQKLLMSERKSQQNMLQEIRSQREEYMAMVQELEAAQEKLAAIMKSLIGQRKEAESELQQGRQIAFEKRKGELPWPVIGDIVRGYGKIVHPVYKTVTTNTGVDIRADEGSAVRCVAPGKVAVIHWIRGLGKLIVIDHGGGYSTIYARMGTISVTQGQNVDFAAVLGTVGKGGHVGESRLHFEIRNLASPLDPRKWLE